MKDLISIVIPIYNESTGIHNNISKIIESLKYFDFDFELVLVDDGSSDGSWEKIRQLKSDYTHFINAVKFSRNFGKESAMFAGLAQAKGDAIVIMDSDLQHPPQLVGEMYNIWKAGYEVVEAVKKERGEESWLSRFFANSFYGLLGKLSGIEMRNACDFRFMDKAVVEALLRMPERQTFFRAMSTWVGFKREQIFFEVPPRMGDSTKWSRWKLFKFALSAITSFSSVPLQFVSVFGLTFLFFAFIMFIQTMYMYFSDHSQSGFTTVILLLLLIGGIMMTSLGVLGLYIAKIYDEIKARPKYIISEKL